MAHLVKLAGKESNPQPPGPKPVVLPIELPAKELKSS